MDGSVRFGEDEIVGSAEEDGHGLARILDPCEFHNFVTGSGHDDIADVIGSAEFVLGERIDVCHGRASEGAADEFDIGAFDICHDKYAHFGEEMER